MVELTILFILMGCAIALRFYVGNLWVIWRVGWCALLLKMFGYSYCFADER